MPDRVTILLVEDNPDDAALTERALHGGAPANLEVARDGQEALDYLFDDANDLPRLVLLDLTAPEHRRARGAAADPRTTSAPRLTPVVILTSSSSPDDVVAGYRYGANSYVRKPVDFDEFAELIRQLGSYWLVVNECAADSRAQ